jgi:hypothetical protein
MRDMAFRILNFWGRSSSKYFIERQADGRTFKFSAVAAGKTEVREARWGAVEAESSGDEEFR